MQLEAKALRLPDGHHWRTTKPADGDGTGGVPASTNCVYCSGAAATSTLGVGGVTLPDLMTTVVGEASTEVPEPATDTAVDAPSMTKDDAGLSCWLGVAYPTNRGGVNDALIFGGVMVPTSGAETILWSKLSIEAGESEDCCIIYC